jgi:hypothetical protein
MNTGIDIRVETDTGAGWKTAPDVLLESSLGASPAEEKP